MMKAQTAVEINEVLANRRSPRSLDATAVLSKREDGTPNKGYLYDCGLAVSQMVVETHHRGLVAHQMTGFDPEKAAQNLGIDASLLPVAVIAIGKQASAEQLEGPLLERENAPRERKALEEIVVKGLPN